MKRERQRERHNSSCVMLKGLKKKFYSLLSVAVILPFFTLFFFCSSEAGEKAEVKDIHFWSSQGYTRVVIELSHPVEFTQKRLSAPDRLYFDLRDARIVKEIKAKLPVGDGILRSVRAGQFDAGTVRIVLDLETMEDFCAYIVDDPTKLVIDVNAERKPEKIDVNAKRKSEKIVSSKKIVILDPGHGGHDSGAVGKKGLQEKDVVLDIALKVRQILSKESNIEIILTRDKDVFVPLPERSLIALQNNADLFVSIHANASPNRAARGIETYLQNWTNEEEANRVAARENYLSVKRMREIMAQYKNDDVGRMLSDLKRDFKRDESVALANYVQASLFSDVARIHKKTVNLGVKQAMFFVLMGPSMPPSVLAEVSFISNPEEERFLADDAYRSIIAGSIAAGIKTYLTSSPDLQKVAFSKNRQ